MVTTLVFDWDATLVNNQRAAYEAMCHVFKICGIAPPSFEHMCRTHGPPFKEWYASHGITVPYEEVVRRYEEGVNRYSYHEQPLFGDVGLVFAQLADENITVGIISGTPSGIIAERLHQHGLTDRVRFVLGSASDKVPAIRAACREFDFCSCDAWYVGDRISDVRDARAAGLISVGITRNYETHNALDEAGSTFNIPHLDALFEVVRGVLRAE